MKRALLFLLSLAVIGIGLFIYLQPLRPASVPFVIGPALPPGPVKPQIATYWDRGYLLSPNGSLWAWGGTIFGKADAQISKCTEVPVQIGTDTDWQTVAASLFVLATKRDGSLWGWGDNACGELCNGVTNHWTTPLRIGTETNWAALSVGATHVMALKRDGSLWTWGGNVHGQVGDGTTSNRFSPFPILPSRRWRAIAAGSFNSYAQCEDGSIWGWGLDTTVGGANHTLTPTPIGTETNWTAISAGAFQLIGLKSDGTLWVHGQNVRLLEPSKPYTPDFLQMGADSDWSELLSGDNFALLRKTNGTWWLVGVDPRFSFSNGHRTQQLPYSLESWALGAGQSVIMLTRDGNLWSLGQRLGTVAPRNQIDELSKTIRAILRGKSPPSSSQRAVVDDEPHLIWSLPPTSAIP